MIDQSIVKRLRKIVGKDGVLDSPEDLASFSIDSTFAEREPDVVVLPTTTEQVSQVVQLAVEENLPIVPRGMASGLAAASIPFSGGIALPLTRMNHILEIDAENRTALVEAGVVTAILQAEVEKIGLFYPPDPSSNRQSTIGGNIACNAGGPRCLKYGVTGDYVLGLKVVLPDGRVLETGGKAIKNVVGYDLNSLFIGSEGTLGIITETLLRLTSKPQFVRTAVAEFPLRLFGRLVPVFQVCPDQPAGHGAHQRAPRSALLAFGQSTDKCASPGADTHSDRRLAVLVQHLARRRLQQHQHSKHPSYPSLVAHGSSPGQE